MVQKLKNRLKLGRSKAPKIKEANKEVNEVVNQPKYEIEPNPVKANQIQANNDVNNNEVNLEFKKQQSAKVNKGYDSIQIDFEPNNDQGKYKHGVIPPQQSNFDFPN